MTISRIRAWRAAVMLVTTAGLSVVARTDAHAQDQSTQAPASPYDLGAIPARDGIACGGRSVSFYAYGVDVVQTIRVEMTVALTGLGAHTATLTSPGGRTVEIFTTLPGRPNPVVGTYYFSDRAGSSWLPFVPANVNAVVPPGHYRALIGTNEISLDQALAGDEATGSWRLDIHNCGATAGQISGARLVIGGTAGSATRATSASMGAIPDGPSTAAQTPGPPRDVQFVVPAGRRAVTRVSVRFGLTHSWAGDLVAELIAPTGQRHILFGYTGATSATAKGGRANLNGYYQFTDDAAFSWWSTLLSAGTGLMPGGRYRTAQRGGAGATGAATAMNPVFAGLPSAGTWTLRFTDGSAGDAGSVYDASLSLETVMIPDAVDDRFSTLYLQPTTIPAPGVLGNDDHNGVPTMGAELVTSTSNGALSLRPDGSFSYTPRLGFAGVDSFRYRATSTLGAGRVATVTITVFTSNTPHPPYELVASEIAGQNVTLRWKAAPGPTPTDFVLEGGVMPGQTVARIGVGGPLPVLSFAAPRGVFYVRVRTVAAGVMSTPSNEIRIAVAVPEAPSAPMQLAGVANGGAVGLSWRNTFAGGEPQGLQLLVAGAATATLPLSLGEAFSIGGVPPGTYTFRMQARNAAGVSTESNPVTLTLPGGCSGAPQVPQNLLVFAVGNMVHAYWDPPAGGPAATNYVLHVTGAFTGAVPVPSRGLHVPAPPGNYAIAVAAQNACGVSAPTAAQTAFVR